MNQRLAYRIIGYLSIVIGIFAGICIFRIQTMVLGLGLSILGFILSGVNIFLNTKYYYEEERYPKGYLGMLFSSLPILFLIFVVFKFKQG
jgi:hypothetical protein